LQGPRAWRSPRAKRARGTSNLSRRHARRLKTLRR
jgi:hypothetical protein